MASTPPLDPSPSGPPPLRFVPAADVPRRLPMDRCIEAVEEAFLALARGGARQPLRTVIPLPDGESSFLAMPAYLAQPAALGAKLLTLFPGNHGTGRESHQGLIVLFDPDHGTPITVVDAGPVTAIRTAAASAVATRALAREDASVLAILGSGAQARTHVEAMRAVRAVREIRVWSRTPAHRDRFAEEMRGRHGLPVRTFPDAGDAVEGADLVCTVTGSATPILEGDRLAAGCHVNAVGASTATTRELDTRTVARSRFYVDRLESARAEAGDWLLARETGEVADAVLVGELGDVLLGRVDGRTRDEDVTVFKSLGLAVQDLAAVAALLPEGG